MKSIPKKRKILIFSVLILMVFLASFSVVFGAGFSWFGGRITYVQKCTCGTGSLVTITGFPWVFSGTYLYFPGVTDTKGKANIISNRMILGNYSSGGSCMMAGDPCYSITPTKGTMIRNIGTN